MASPKRRPVMGGAICGHEVYLNKQSSMQLCDACSAAIPPLRDDQALPARLRGRFAMLRKAARRPKKRGR